MGKSNATVANTASLYPVEELAAHATALFAVQSEVMTGALYGSGKQELTVDEAKALIDQFMNRKVNENGGR
jgi:hypothetical protein